MSKWNLSNHITGKVYDLTQENMNAIIADIENKECLCPACGTDWMYGDPQSARKTICKDIDRLEAENARLREALELILEQYPKHYEIRITEIAREALKGGE